MAVKEKELITSETTQTQSPESLWDKLNFKKVKRRLGQLSWQAWAIILVTLSGSLGFTATVLLLKLPENPNCPRIFWPIASASMRIYCAQLEAETNTVDSLLRAIELVEPLSQNHPLREEIDRNIEEWAVGILNLAENEFQAGEINLAIDTARKIPSQLKAHSLVDERISRWEAIWTQGEEIFAKVEQHLREAEWNFAFRQAVKLLNLDNQYWATVKYDDTIRRITLAQEESRKLDVAYRLLRSNGFDDWIKAIEAAEKIPKESYAYQEAGGLIDKIKDKVIGYAENLVNNRNWQRLDEVAGRIPLRLGLQTEVDDWRTLANAGLDAQVGTPESIEAAIASLEQIDSSSPIYSEAQELIDRWQLEIDDVNRLAKARDLAQSGDVSQLNAAISEVELIPSANPRYREAQSEIREWNRQVQTIEDQPYLDRARELARDGSIPALQQAINEASSITPSRALYSEAQTQIGDWRRRIQLQQDRPLLNQAIALGNAKDYTGAINAANRILRGRVLYPDAQGKVQSWRRELKARGDLEKAYLVAQAKTPESLVSAMSILRRIPNSADIKEQSRLALNRWSYQLLTMAGERANNGSYFEAINLAKSIPQNSAAYESAQAQINVWQQSIQPPAPPAPAVRPPLLQTGFSEPQTPQNPELSPPISVNGTE